MFWALAVVAALIAGAWLLGARERVFKISRGAPAYFVALKRSGEGAPTLAPGISIAWRSRADFTFIGEGDAYWTDFFILTGEGNPLPLGPEIADAYVARVALLRPPILALGVLKLLVLTGLLSRPRGQTLTDPRALGRVQAFMPSVEAIAGLTTRPPTYQPAMVNFLQYKPDGGARAYRRYGRVALRTVYRTGGHLLFYGRIEQVLHAAKSGPCLGAWDDVAAMRYNRPEAILTMEHAPDYRAALSARDEGLLRTCVIASTPEGEG